MGDPILATLVLPRDGIYRGVLLGFKATAVSFGWRVEVLSPSVTMPIDRIIESLETQPSNILVLSYLVWEHLTSKARQGRVLISAEHDLTAAGIPSVLVDNRAIGEEAAAHLLERGFRNFAAYGLGGHCHFATERAASFRAAVQRAGGRFIPWTTGDSHPLPMDSQSWISGCAQWARSLPPQTGVLACCDPWGHDLTLKLSALNIRVPDDLAVVSVDNEELYCELSNPPLSSIALPWHRMGAELAHLAEQALKGRPLPRKPVLIGSPRTIVRQSSDVLAVRDPEVCAAMKFIRDHAGTSVGVPDILGATSTNRRSLERRFRQYLGRSIMQEVRRAHVEQAKRLLTMTALSIGKISSLSGFPNSKKFAQVFREESGITPSEYRVKYQPRT